MIIGVHPDLIGAESYSDKWAEVLRAHGVEVRFIDLLAADALEQAAACDGVMWRWAHSPHYKQSAQRILYTIEHYLKVPVFPDSRTAWHYDEKIAQYYLLDALMAPVPQAWLFWDYKSALRWAQTAPYPVVFKLSSGAASANVIKINTEAEAKALVKRSFWRGIFPNSFNEFQHLRGGARSIIRDTLLRMRRSIRYVVQGLYPPLPDSWFWRPEKGYAYFQEFLPNNHFDTRVTIIGERAFAFRRMNRPGDFRASGSGLIEFDPSLVDPLCLEIAFRVSESGNFQSMAYDFLYKDGKPVICEISYAFADWAVHECPGHWICNMTWQEGNMWPEEAQAIDFINRIKAFKRC
ncbi:MAG: hypothetical protein JW726_01350 [Anaerolineales bacterium]|nr:hypothetical protein [Anaerolineales bacterium]